MRFVLMAAALLGTCGFTPVFACPTDRWHELVCAGPTVDIPDDDPALELFSGDLESRKIALAIERVNSCDRTSN